MKAQVAELVDVILRRIEEHPDAPPSERGVRVWLSRQGYKSPDIDAAIKLVSSRLAQRPKMASRSNVALRHFAGYELFKLTPEAREALHRIELYDLVEPQEFEMLLDRIAAHEGEVSMDELDYYVSWLLCSTRDVESQQTIYDVLENNREMLN